MKKYLPYLRTAVFCMLLLSALLFLLNRCFVPDTSARRTGTGFVWRGNTYVACGYTDYQGKRTLARTDDGFTIVSIEGDTEHRFLVLASFLDSELCFKEDYEIPTEGELNGVYWIGRKISNKGLCSAVSDVLKNFHSDFIYETEAMSPLTKERQLKEISFCFENCPVGVDPFDSYMGKLNGEWVFARQASHHEESGNRVYVYDIYRIPEEYHDTISTFWLD